MNAPDAVAPLDMRILFSVPGMCDNRSGIRTRVMSAYGMEAAAAIAILRSASAAGDGQAVRLAAHRLKSASGAFGAMRVYGLAHAIENAARDGRGGFDAHLQAGLEQAVRQTLIALGALDSANAPMTHSARGEPESRT